MVTDSVARTFFLKIPKFRPKNHENHENHVRHENLEKHVRHEILTLREVVGNVFVSSNHPDIQGVRDKVDAGNVLL